MGPGEKREAGQVLAAALLEGYQGSKTKLRALPA